MYEVVDVSSWQRVREEPMGGKVKEWLEDPGGKLWLFKEVGRRTGAPGSAALGLVGEHWAEKITSVLAASLGIEAAVVELAQAGNRLGCISASIVSPNEELVHGNELLWASDPEYPKAGTFGLWYTVEAALRALESYVGPISSDPTAVARFVAYLWFDAWVANTDRHHENWAVLRGHGAARLAPSFDHASSLGFNLSDESRQARLTSRDKGFNVSAWAGSSKTSPFYRAGGRLTALDAALEGSRITGRSEPDVRDLLSAGMPDLEGVVGDVPGELMSSAAKEFAVQVLVANARRILST